MPDEADTLADDLRRVVGCVTASRLLIRPVGRDRPSGWTAQFVSPAPLRAANPLAGATLTVRLTSYVVDAAPRVSAYLIGFHDRAGVELLAWHWQPGPAAAGPDHPHLHVSAALRPTLAPGDRAILPLDKLHLTTGFVPLAAVVRMLIEEFGVQPLAADWRERLADEPG